MVPSLLSKGIFSLLSLLLLSLSLPGQSSIDQNDQDAMDDFYNSLSNKGDLPDPAPTDWCDNINGVACTDGKVIIIDMENFQLKGTLSSSLGNLTALSNLVLSDNEFSGTIPSEFGNLSNLTRIDLGLNSLNGTIPSELSNLRSIDTLVFYTNTLTGTIPSVLGELSSIIYLDLGNNLLNGTIPTELGNLTSLDTLYLDGNQLTGTIPTELGNLKSVTVLYLNDNALTGTIPPELGNLTSLDELQLSSNQLSGTIPSELANISFLQNLYLDENHLTGTIPITLGNMTNLKEMELMGTNNFCPLLDYSSWAPGNNDYPGSTNCTACANFTCQNNGTCSGGFNELFTCSCSSGWFGSNCELDGCPAETPEHASFPAAPPGSSANGTCDQGYYGSPSRLCQDGGSWGDVVNPCTACGCSSSGSMSQTCNSEGHCECKEGFAGNKCTQCAEGYTGPNCTPDSDSPGSQMFLSWNLVMTALCLCFSILLL